jgi:hypothetical protein
MPHGPLVAYLRHQLWHALHHHFRFRVAPQARQLRQESTPGRPSMWQRWHSPLTKYWVRDPHRRHGSGWNGPPG